MDNNKTKNKKKDKYEAYITEKEVKNDTKHSMLRTEFLKIRIVILGWQYGLQLRIFLSEGSVIAGKQFIKPHLQLSFNDECTSYLCSPSCHITNTVKGQENMCLPWWQYTRIHPKWCSTIRRTLQQYRWIGVKRGQDTMNDGANFLLKSSVQILKSPSFLNLTSFFACLRTWGTQRSLFSSCTRRQTENKQE